MASERKVSTDDGRDFAESLGLEFLETSAKNATNVEETFNRIATAIKQKLED